MAIGISYVYKNPNVAGESCPVCGRKSWDIFRCNKCGSVFCKYCSPGCIKNDPDPDVGDIYVTCPKCGNIGTFSRFLDVIHFFAVRIRIFKITKKYSK